MLFVSDGAKLIVLSEIFSLLTIKLQFAILFIPYVGYEMLWQAEQEDLYSDGKWNNLVYMPCKKKTDLCLKPGRKG